MTEVRVKHCISFESLRTSGEKCFNRKSDENETEQGTMTTQNIVGTRGQRTEGEKRSV